VRALEALHLAGIVGIAVWLARLSQIGEARGNKPRQVVPAFDFPQERQTSIGTHLRAIEIEKDGFAVQG